MRNLRFIVEGQIIRQDPSCDFSGLFPGTQGYLKAEFLFSKEWKDCRKAAVFDLLRDEYPVPLIGNSCEIPADVLTWKSFSVQVVGERDGYRITTNKVEVKQNG